MKKNLIQKKVENEFFSSFSNFVFVPELFIIFLIKMIAFHKLIFHVYYEEVY